MSADVALLGRLMDSRPNDLERQVLRQWLSPKPAPEWSVYADRADEAETKAERDHDRRDYGAGRSEVPYHSRGRYKMLVRGEEREESARTARELGVPDHLANGQMGKPRNLLNHDGSLTPEFHRRFRKETPTLERPPKTRAGCASVPRPCPFSSCRYNLYLHVTFNGSVRLSHPDDDPEDVHPAYSCALDVAERGPHTLDAVARVLGMTRERARQIEESALADLARLLGAGHGEE